MPAARTCNESEHEATVDHMFHQYPQWASAK